MNRIKRRLFAAAMALALLLSAYLAWKPPSSGQVTAVCREGADGAGERGASFVLVEGETYAAVGRVDQVEFHSAEKQGQWWVILDSVSILKNAEENVWDVPAADISCKLICKTEGLHRPKIGATVRVRGQFSYFSQGVNPGEFDQAEYYRILGIGGNLEKAGILAESEDYSVYRETLWRLHSFWKERLFHLFPEKEASILSTMLLGDKTSLDSGIKDLYKRNGIVHILSISGLHITLIGMGIYRLLRKAGCPLCPAAILGSVVLVSYGFLTGLGISSCRAIGMYLIRMLGEIVGRSYDMLTALGFMGIWMLIRQPEYLRHSGFLLSFGSICGIGLLLPRMQPEGSLRRDGGHSSSFVRRIAAGLWNLLAPGLAIAIFTLPVHLCFYYELPVYSLFLNLLVLPFMGVLMGTGLTAMLLPDFLLPLAVLPVTAGRAILGIYEKLCGLFERLPFHTWRPGCPRTWQVIAFYLLLAVFILAGGYLREAASSRGKSSGKYAFLLPALPAAAILIIGIRFHAGLEITFLDVGQGDGIFVRTQKQEIYLFDCGSSSERSIGKYALIPFLKYQGVTRIDGVFLSHPDADHCNGIQELLELGQKEGIVIERIFLPDIAGEKKKSDYESLIKAVDSSPQEPSVSLRFMSKGDAWKSGRTVFTCLHPLTGSSMEDTNEYSLCFLLEQDSFTMLLTGDVQGAGEEQLMKTLREESVQDISLLKVAHHGSRNSTPESLLQLLNPRIAVISCGKDNAYGHPHPELMERLVRTGCRIYLTPYTGAVTFRLRRNRLKAQTYRPVFD